MSVPILRWVIDGDGGSKFSFETLYEAERWGEANGYGPDTNRRLEPEEAKYYSAMFEGYDELEDFSVAFDPRR